MLLESQGSAPGDNHNHQKSGGGKDDQKARSVGEKIPKNWKSWLRRQKDDRENGRGRWKRQRAEKSGRRWLRRRKGGRESGWGRRNHQKDGMMLSPSEGSEVVKGEVHRKRRSSRVSCPEKGEFPSGLRGGERLGGDHLGEMGIWGDH